MSFGGDVLLMRSSGAGLLEGINEFVEFAGSRGHSDKCVVNALTMEHWGEAWSE